jgi:hypothetical protein
MRTIHNYVESKSTAVTGVNISTTYNECMFAANIFEKLLKPLTHFEILTILK